METDAMATVHTLFHPNSLNLPKLLEPPLPSGDWKDLVEKKTHLEETNAVLRFKLFFFLTLKVWAPSTNQQYGR